jgi:hypothetical protein
VFAFDFCVMFIVFIVFFVFILVPRHKSRESMKIGPHPRGHPSSPSLAPGLRQMANFMGLAISLVDVPSGLKTR